MNNVQSMMHTIIMINDASFFPYIASLSPEMDVAYRTQDEKIRLLDLYRNMHNRIHSTSRPLKLIYHSAERETLLAWVCDNLFLEESR